MTLPGRQLFALTAAATLLGAAPAAMGAGAKCPVVSSQDWQAWLAPTPFSNRKLMLHVRGTVTLPTPGYDVRLVEGPITRSIPPIQTVWLQVRSPGAETVAQVLSTQSVSIIMRGFETYKSVRILCGNTPLREFSDVPQLK
ncbi:MAG: hypothetical protein KDJ73_12085 [Notoacmeibacter sp.]|nr:hypothetical protein [Notoacmeibacter sp.]MCC0032161.1 hypothetical protein [Brucellaceae bacterium]